MACGMPASWRGCVPGRMRGPGSTHRDSEAAGLHLTPLCGTFIPAQGLGVPWASGINVRRVIHKVCWVHVPEAKRRHRRAACEHRSRRCSPMPTPERRRLDTCAGSDRPVGHCSAMSLPVPSLRRLGVTECRPVRAALASIETAGREARRRSL